MAIQFSTTLRDNQLDQIESTVGAAPLLKLFSGPKPATCASPDSGTMCLQMTLPSDWMAAASGGVKSLIGSWAGTGHASAGTGTTVGHFRIYDASGTTCHMQGSVTATGAGGDMTLVNTSVAQNQTVTINGFDVTAGNG